jgi:hypothetical protein
MFETIIPESVVSTSGPLPQVSVTINLPPQPEARSSARLA